MICPNCDHENIAEAMFCNKCGVELGEGGTANDADINNRLSRVEEEIKILGPLKKLAIGFGIDPDNVSDEDVEKITKNAPALKQKAKGLAGMFLGGFGFGGSSSDDDE